MRNSGICLFGLFVLSPSDECVLARENFFLGPTIHLLVLKIISSFIIRNKHVYFNILLGYVFKRSGIIICFPHSEFAMTLVGSRPEDAFLDLLPSSI